MAVFRAMNMDLHDFIAIEHESVLAWSEVRLIASAIENLQESRQIRRFVGDPVDLPLEIILGVLGRAKLEVDDVISWSSAPWCTGIERLEPELLEFDTVRLARRDGRISMWGAFIMKHSKDVLRVHWVQNQSARNRKAERGVSYGWDCQHGV
jgi:hypothetical protein